MMDAEGMKGREKRNVECELISVLYWIRRNVLMAKHTAVVIIIQTEVT